MDKETEEHNLFAPFEAFRFFEFPIYRTSPKKFWVDRGHAMDKIVASMGYEKLSDMPERSRNIRINIHDQDWGQFWYNQIIGWARLTQSRPGRRGSDATIKGYYSRRESQRVSRNCRARFEGTYKFTEFTLRRKQSDQQIADEIRAEVSELTKRGRAFAGRYIDFEIYDSLAPYVDFHELLNISATPDEGESSPSPHAPDPLIPRC
jgi:hypothetical protein